MENTELFKGKTIDVRVKEWWDEDNGNTYFSARICITGEETIYIPFMYGYGSFADSYACEVIAKKYNLKVVYPYCKQLERLGKAEKVFFEKKEDCTYKEVIAYGSNALLPSKETHVIS